MHKIILTDAEPGLNPSSEELTKIIIERLGLMPRKKGSTKNMYRVLLELYERAKLASKLKDQRHSIMTVDEMALFAGITKQTMYEYLPRWLGLNFITKSKFIDKNGKNVVGYRLNGNTIEEAFERVKITINNNLNFTGRYIKELQKLIKNEKIRATQKQKKLFES